MSATFQRNSMSPKKNNDVKFFNRPLSSFSASKQFKKKDTITLKNVDVDKAVYIS